MDEDPLYNSMLREMELTESEIWFNVNIKNHISPLEIENAKKKVHEAREAIHKKYQTLAKEAKKNPKKKQDVIPILQNILNNKNLMPQDDFAKLETLIEQEAGIDVKRFRDRKVTRRDLETLLKQLDSDEYKELAGDVDKMFNKETWKSLGLDGNESDKLEDHQVENLKHMMKKDLQKHPDHAELLAQQYGKPFEEVLDDFGEYNKKL